MEKEIGLFKTINKKMDEEDILMIGSLQQAYIGDAVYEILVRSYILSNKNVNKLHNQAKKYVSAQSQAHILKKIWDKLTEKEKSIIKKGRNTKSNTSSKNASISDYRYSTGFEALFGYLYLNNKNDRILEIFNEIIQIKNQGKEDKV